MEEIKMNKIALITAVYRRPIFTNYMLWWYNELKKELEKDIQLELFAIGSEGRKSRDLCQKNGFNYIEYKDNDSLSYKFNEVSQFCRQCNPDGVVLVGSDDLLSKDMFYFYDKAINKKILILGFIDGYFIDLKRRELIYWRGYNDEKRLEKTWGVGRFFSRDIMERFNWRLWGNKVQKKYLDKLCYNNLKEKGVEIESFNLREEGLFMVSIKLKESLTDISVIRKNGETLDYQQLLEFIPLDKYLKLEKVINLLIKNKNYENTN